MSTITNGVEAVKMNEMSDLWTVALDMKRDAKVNSTEAQLEFVAKRAECINNKKAQNMIKEMCKAEKRAENKANKTNKSIAEEQIMMFNDVEIAKSVRVTNNGVSGIFTTDSKVLWNMSFNAIKEMIGSYKWLNNKPGEKGTNAFLAKYTLVSEYNVGDAIRRLERNILNDLEQTNVVISGDEGLNCPVNKELNESTQSWLTDYVRRNDQMIYMQTLNDEVDMRIGEKEVVANKSSYIDVASKDVEGRAYDNITIEDTANPTGYCSNFDCETRLVNEDTKELRAKVSELTTKIDEKQMEMVKMYKHIHGMYGKTMVGKLPTVVVNPSITQTKPIENAAKASKVDGKWVSEINRRGERKYKINPNAVIAPRKMGDECKSIDILKGYFAGVSYKNGDTNMGTKRIFIDKLGYNNGVDAFNKYAMYVTMYETLKSEVWDMINERKELKAEISELSSYGHGYDNDEGVRAKNNAAYRNGAALVHVDYIEVAQNVEVAVCPYCGEPVYIESQVVKDSTYNVSANDVRNELDDETYNFLDADGNIDRTVVIDENGTLLNDSNYDVDSMEDIEAIMAERRAELMDDATKAYSNDCDYTPVFDEENDTSMWSNEVAAAVSDYSYESVTNESMEEFYADASEDISKEDIEGYNKTMREHKKLARWTSLRKGCSVAKSGAILATEYNGRTNAGGWSADLFHADSAMIGYNDEEFTEYHNFGTKLANAFIDMKDGARLDDMVDSIMAMESYTDYVTHDRTSRYVGNLCTAELIQHYTWSNDDRLLAAEYDARGLKFVPSVK